MPERIRQILAANTKYVEAFGERASLPPRSLRKLAMLTCMDTRIDPLAVTGSKVGDLQVIRNAGGRASEDAVRSLLVSSKFLGTNAWLIVHHTECGMQRVTKRMVERKFRAEIDSARDVDWLTIDSQPQTLLDDARRLQHHPLVSDDIIVFAMMYDVKTGELRDFTDQI